MILLIDNYDSFSYNLYQLIGSINPKIKVIRNDEKTVAQIKTMNPQCIIISPGPGKPSEAGICEEVVQSLGDKIPILGVCLGHQAICESFGGTVTYAKTLMHGKQSETKIEADPIFSGLGNTIPVARYHSLALDESTLPACLDIIARSDDQEVMAVKHKEYPIYGLQFHPESIMTPDGEQIIRNFLKIAGGKRK